MVLRRRCPSARTAYTKRHLYQRDPKGFNEVNHCMKHEEEDELRLILFFLNCNAML
jgi:hypothetical protein